MHKTVHESSITLYPRLDKDEYQVTHEHLMDVLKENTQYDNKRYFWTVTRIDEVGAFPKIIVNITDVKDIYLPKWFRPAWNLVGLAILFWWIWYIFH